MKPKNHRLHFAFLIIACTLGYASQAQVQRVENLRNYYKEPLHFGFTLGVNSTNFILHPAKDFYLFDSLKAVLPLGAPGFNLGIVSELRLAEYITFRFVPSLSFAQRSIEYYFITSSENYIQTKKVESTFIDLPLDLKLRSKRINNFSAYVLGGGKYSFDLASQKDVKDDPVNQIVKLKKTDLAYEMGAGIEFFLPYFKLGFELKLSVGTRDLLVRNNTIYSNSINRLNSQVLLFSITFEG